MKLFGRLRVPLAAMAVLTCGCAPLRYINQAPFIERHVRASRDPTWLAMFKAAVLVPARDILILDPVWRQVFGDTAWNGSDGGVDDSSFYTNRSPDELTPERVALGPAPELRPRPPFAIQKLRARHGRRSFVGRDACGRIYLFKLDDEQYPELATSATIIGQRILWAAGYNVPPVFLVDIEGTGDPHFDGRRATATLYLENARGHFHFDWFRYRRELRGLRLVSAWINDVDRVDTNTLVVEEDGRAIYYLIDFDSCLGAWQGRPKESWRGWRYQWDIAWTFARLLTLGLAHPEPQPRQAVVSPALGRFAADDFDPLAWRPQVPNSAFEHMDAADRRWIVAKIAQLGRPQIERIVAEARLSNPADGRYLVEALLGRRARILALAGE